MTKYTPATVAKALVGAVVAASATYATAMIDGAIDPGEWALIFGSAATAFGGVFVTPNKDHKPAPAPVSPADQVISALPTVVEQAAQAVSELDRVKQVAADAFGTTVQQVIDAVKLPRP